MQDFENQYGGGQPDEPPVPPESSGADGSTPPYGEHTNESTPYGNAGNGSAPSYGEHTNESTPPYGNIGNGSAPFYGDGANGSPSPYGDYANGSASPFGNDASGSTAPFGNGGAWEPNGQRRADPDGGYYDPSFRENGYGMPRHADQYPDGQQNRRYAPNGQPPIGPAYPYGGNGGNGGGQRSRGKGGAGLVVLIVLLVGIAVASLVGLVSAFFPTVGSRILSPENAGTLEPSTGAGPSIDLADAPTAAGGGFHTGDPDALSSEEIYKKIIDSSVGILLYAEETKQLASEGSGVIIGEDDGGQYTYIVTCAHVIRPSGMSFKVLLSDDTTCNASVVGYDTRTDIGVIRIERTGLQKAEFADVSSLAVGQPVYAIGNPGGSEFAGSFTNGMISAIARPISSSTTGYTTRCIQHTAAINPGNSGGALLNTYGQVIGINSMKIVEQSYEGMGFAVPADIVREIVNDLIVNGYIPDRAKLGITYRPATAYETYSMVVQIRGLPKGSLVIESISEDSDLLNTQARQGDMIIAVNGKNLDDTETLPAMIENAKAGDELTLSMIRVNSDYSLKEFEVSVKLVADMGSLSN